VSIIPGIETGAPERIEEVTKIFDYIPPEIRNPAFDITPAEYITGIITEKGIIKP